MDLCIRSLQVHDSGASNCSRDLITKQQAKRHAWTCACTTHVCAVPQRTPTCYTWLFMSKVPGSYQSQSAKSKRCASGLLLSWLCLGLLKLLLLDGVAFVRFDMVEPLGSLGLEVFCFELEQTNHSDEACGRRHVRRGRRLKTLLKGDTGKIRLLQGFECAVFPKSKF